MRHVINCIRLWNLGSASGVTRRILNVRGQYGLDIVKRWSSCVTDLRLDSSFTASWGHSPVEFGQRLRRNLKIVDVRGQIWMRHVINCVRLWN
jgi:hypothetical protein